MTPAAAAAPAAAPPSAAPGRARLLAAVLWMFGALASFVAMAIGIRAVGDTLGTFEILTWRSLIGLAVVGAVVAARGPGPLRTRQPVRQLTRNLVHFGGQYLWTLSLALLPLSVLTALEFTGPAWAGLFAVLLAGERLTRGRGLAIALGFLGVLVILRPGLAIVDPAAPLVLLAAALYAYAHVSGKLLVRTDAPLAVAFYMAAIQLPLAAAPAAFAWTGPAPGDWPWLMALGLGGLGGHYCLSQALARADAMTVTPVDFLRLPLMTAIGIFFYREPFDPWAVLGGAVICLGIWCSLRGGIGAPRPAAAAAPPAA